jgi:ABC-type dipeptide/oligopeptide/nickel transport system permease subunit
MRSFFKILYKNKALSFYFFLVIIVIIIGLTSDILAPNDIYQANYDKILQPPSKQFPFGTDYMGRCVFSRIICGTTMTLKMAFSAVALVFLLGTFLGIISGYFGGAVNSIIMRLIDILLAFPSTILAIVIAGITGGGLQNAVIAIAVVSWPRYARLSRSLVVKEKVNLYIDAARMLGTSSFVILYRHILPNVISIMILTAVMDIGIFIMGLAGLSYLGLGAQPPAPEWGIMLSGGQAYFMVAPWLLIAPTLAIFTVVVIWNLLGDSLRDFLDPTSIKFSRKKKKGNRWI